MAVDIFKDTRTNLPDNDSRIVRVGFDEEQLGNRRAQQPNVKSDGRFGIQHVNTGRGKK
ncbi:MAG TPA: hypothetical protein VMT20_15320 [Terriglobia bacterium]|nr:hypothetical protein [Terriglobia bacterium]